MILPSRSKTSGLVMPPREKEKTQPVVTPTNNVRTVGLKDFLGGGEYKVQTPGQVTLTERGYSNMPTLSGSERDHKVPVSLGGTSSNKNLQYLKTTSAGRQEGKVAVEQDVINDFKSGKISLGEARLKIATKNQQILGLTPTEKEQDISGVMKGIEKFVNFSNKVADVVDPIKNIKKFVDFSNKAGDIVDEGRKVLEAIGKGLILPKYKEARQKGWNSGVLGTSASLQASIANFVDMAQLTPLAIKTEGTPLRDSIMSSARKDQELSRAFNDLEKATGAKVVDERAFAEKIKDPNFIAEGFTQNLPNLLVSLGVSAPAAILGSPALATAGLLFGTTMALEGGFAYNEAIDFGATEEEAKKAGALTGIANGLLESIPVFKLITRSPAGKQLKRTILSRITRNILRVGKQSGLEGGTESLQEIIANAVALTYDENRDLFSGVQESAFFGALIGGISSVGMDTVKETGGKIPGLTLEDVSLEQEAKKYKSAEEFIKAQGEVLYHGTAGKFDTFDNKMTGSVTGAKSAHGATWFTNDKDVAKAYSIYAAESGPINKLQRQADELDKIARKSGKESDWAKYDKVIEEMEKLDTYDANFKRRELANVKEAVLDGDFYKVDAKGKSPQELSADGDIDSWLSLQVKKAKELKKDGLIIENIDDAVGLYDKPSTHYAVFDTSKIKTKSQLTDIWNKAQKLKPEVKVEPQTEQTEQTEETKQPTPAQIKRENINILKQELSTERDKINFIKSVGEMKQSVISDAKKKLGLKFPVTQMTLKELDMLQGELNRRLEFKVDKGFVAKGDTKLKPIPQEIYDKKDFKPFKSKSNLGKGIDKYLGVISTRLANIDISLKQKVRKLEYDNANQTQKRKEIILPFLEKTKDMSKNDWDTYDLALKNGDKAKIDEINSKYDMEGEYDSIKVLLDDIYSQLESVGYELGYKKNYFPRTIKDSNGLLDYLSGTEDWSIILEAKNKKEMELGRSLDAYELAIMVNSMIRGYSAGQITLAKTGAMKTRKIDIVDQELNQFYSDSRSSILRYIEQATEAVNAKKFFGKELEMTIDGVKKLRVEDSVGAYTTKLLAEGKITPSQELELRSILTARFAPKSTTGFGTIFKNLTYIDVMGSPLNAITQIGDLAFPLYKAGFFRTIKGIGKSIMGKSPIKKEDIGIEQIAQEFSEQSKLATAVGMVFKAIGLTKMDSIGKQTLIDAVISKMRSQAKSKDQNTQAQLRAELEKVFDKQDVSEVIQDLKSGNITENVKYLAFNKLLDFQPVALSEVPEKYLSSGNGRIFYTLKTWTIKMFDVYRNEAFQDISSGNKQQVIKGLQNLIRLSMCLVLMNATADTIKDLLLGRKIELNDLVIDNIAKLFGLSKYQLDLSSKEGIGSTLISTILPPTQLVDSAYKDINKSIKANELDIQNLSTWKSVPIVGKLYYWWFGKGAEYKKSTKPKGLDLDIDLDLGLDSDIDLDLDLDLDI